MLTAAGRSTSMPGIFRCAPNPCRQKNCKYNSISTEIVLPSWRCNTTFLKLFHHPRILKQRIQIDSENDRFHMPSTTWAVLHKIISVQNVKMRAESKGCLHCVYKVLLFSSTKKFVGTDSGILVPGAHSLWGLKKKKRNSKIESPPPKKIISKMYLLVNCEAFPWVRV